MNRKTQAGLVKMQAFTAFLITFAMILGGCRNSVDVFSDSYSQLLSVVEKDVFDNEEQSSLTDGFSSATDENSTQSSAVNEVPSTPNKNESDPATQSTVESVTQELRPDERPTDVNKYRPDYNLGICKELSGTVAVSIIYVNDFESGRNEEETQRFTENEVKPGLDFLEAQAKNYGVELNFKITDIFVQVEYDYEVILNADTGFVTIDVLYHSAQELGYGSDTNLYNQIKGRENANGVIFLTVFNKNGRAYAINPKADQNLGIEEHCVLFARDLNSGSGYYPSGIQASIVAHEILHMYGAEDFYSSEKRKALAEQHYPNDIMLSAKYNLSRNVLGDATAFYIGWTDNIPDVIKSEDWAE